MADELTPEDKKEIMAWLTKKWVTPKTCPICSHNNWIIAGDLTTPIRLSGGNFNIGGTTYPMFLLVCGNCGFTHHFNAAVAKLSALDKKPGGDSGDTS